MEAVTIVSLSAATDVVNLIFDERHQILNGPVVPGSAANLRRLQSSSSAGGWMHNLSGGSSDALPTPCLCSRVKLSFAVRLYD